MDKINEDGYRVTDTHVFFYKEWLSNFGKSKFELTFEWASKNKLYGGPWPYRKTGTFFCAEQAFMWAKALFFGDYEIASKILAEKESPMKCKNLGRQVKNYDDAEWNRVRFDIMYRVNLAKYQQNKDLCRKLFNPDFWGKKFVEASPTDRIWGVGMDLSDDHIVDPDNWNGQNLLGNVITKVRDEISLEGMCRVEDLIEHLKKYDPKAFVCTGEMNAFAGGFWQHIGKDQLSMFVHSVEEDKKDVEERFRNNEGQKNHILSRDYIYVNDNDVLVRF